MKILLQTCRSLGQEQVKVLHLPVLTLSLQHVLLACRLPLPVLPLSSTPEFLSHKFLHQTKTFSLSLLISFLLYPSAFSESLSFFLIYHVPTVLTVPSRYNKYNFHSSADISFTKTHPFLYQ